LIRYKRGFIDDERLFDAKLPAGDDG